MAAAMEGEQGGGDEELLAAANEVVLKLHGASKAGNLTEMKELLDKSAAVANTRDRNSFSSALHVAVRAGQGEAVRLLLSKGASPLLPDKEGLTSLDHARVRNKHDILDDLWAHVKADPPTIKEIGPLLSALFEAPMRMSNLEWALQHYETQKLLDAKGRDHRTPLHFVITNNDPALVHRLLDLGADPFVKDAAGLSPLDMAKQAADPEITNALATAMRTQLFAFAGLAVLFFVFRNRRDPQLAWYLVGVLYPSVRTISCLLKDTTRDALAEWLTYWALAGPVLMLEMVAFNYVPKHYWQATADAIVAPSSSTSGGDGGGDGGAAALLGLGSALDLYMMVKIAATLYLLYPASRGARTIYQKVLAPIAEGRQRPQPGGGGVRRGGDKGSKAN